MSARVRQPNIVALCFCGYLGNIMAKSCGSSNAALERPPSTRRTTQSGRGLCVPSRPDGEAGIAAKAGGPESFSQNHNGAARSYADGIHSDDPHEDSIKDVVTPRGKMPRLRHAIGEIGHVPESQRRPHNGWRTEASNSSRNSAHVHQCPSFFDDPCTLKRGETFQTSPRNVSWSQLLGICAYLNVGPSRPGNPASGLQATP